MQIEKPKIELEKPVMLIEKLQIHKVGETSDEDRESLVKNVKIDGAIWI